MNKNKIAKKYSRAIINSVEITEVPAMIEELKSFAGLIEENRKLKLLVVDLSLDKQMLQDVLKKALKSVEK